MLQDLVADPVHGRDDGGVRVPDVDRRHVGHGRRVHDVGRHDSKIRHSKGGKFKFGQRDHCELSQLTEECTQARAMDRPTDRATTRARHVRERARSLRVNQIPKRGHDDRGTDNMAQDGGPKEKQVQSEEAK